MQTRKTFSWLTFIIILAALLMCMAGCTSRRDVTFRAKRLTPWGNAPKGVYIIDADSALKAGDTITNEYMNGSTFILLQRVK